MLRRFIRGQASRSELELAARALEVASVTELCQALAAAFEGWLQIDLEFADVARQIAAHGEGKLSQSELRLWANCAHTVLTSTDVTVVAGSTAAHAQGTLAPTLKLLSFLLDPRHTAPRLKTRCALLRIKKHLDTGRPVPMRTFLPSLFRDLGTLRFKVLESPLEFSPAARDHWIDIGLTGMSYDEVRLTPLSIFTRRFFWSDLRDVVAEKGDPLDLERVRGDRFCYHPENDQSLSLRERFPLIARIPVRFQYFVDETGLAEIVFDSATLTRSHVRLAAKLFCLQNGVRRAMLDGRRMLVCSGGSRWK